MMEKRNQLLFAIAIDEYQSTFFAPLCNAVSDTNRVAEVLQQRYGFKLADEPLFDEKATRRNIFRGLTDLVASLDDRDDLIIYFAGHGLSRFEYPGFKVDDDIRWGRGCVGWCSGTG